MIEQVVPFPLVGGVDEKAHPRLCSRLLTMQNCRQMKDGSIGKRYGTVCIGTKNLRLDGTTPPTGELLATRGNELVRVGGGALDSYAAVGTASDYVYRAPACEMLATRDTVLGDVSGVETPDCVYVNGYRIIVVAAVSAPTTGASTFTIVMTVIDDATGAPVISRLDIESSLTTGTALTCPRLAVIGTKVFVVYLSAGTAIRAATFDTATMALTLTGNLVIFVSGTALQIETASMSDRFALVWHSAAGSGAPGLTVATYSSALAVLAGPTVVENVVGVVDYRLGMRGTTGETLWLVAKQGAAPNELRAYGLNPATLATTFGPLALQDANTVRACSVERTSATTATAVWTTDANPRTEWASFNSAGVRTDGGALNNNKFTYGIRLRSKPFFANSTLYALVRNHLDTAVSLFVAAFDTASTHTAANSPARIAAVLAPRQVIRQDRNSIGTLSSWGNPGSGRYLMAAFISTGGPLGLAQTASIELKTQSTRPVASYSDALLHLAGGVPSLYDGGTVAEIGFAFDPAAGNTVTAVSAAGGSMTSSATYRYLYTYEWRTSNGAIVRSVPSDLANPTTITMGAADTKVTLTIPTIGFTNKHGTASPDRAIAIIVWRTTAGGATYYRQTRPDEVPAECLNVLTATTITVVDTLDDATLATRAILYTTGGVLPDEIPPSAGHVMVAGGRVWLSATDDDSIWFSAKLVSGEAPRFSSGRTISPIDGGRIVAMGYLGEGKYVVFKQDSMFLLYGEGPNDTGTDGSFADPERIPSEVGCIDARSVVAVPQGLMFLSRAGICLLTRGLEVVQLGKAIEDTLGTASVHVAALTPEQSVVRFGIEGTGKLAEIDNYHGGAWGIGTYDDPASTGKTIVAGTYWNGAWVHLLSNGKLFRETRTAWTDTNGATVAFVPSTIRLRYISLSDLQGYQRVWWVSALGEQQTAHDLTMKAYVDDESSTSQSITFTASAMSTWTRWQPQLHLVHQEAEAISVEISDATPTGGPAVGTGRGFVLAGVSMELGLERGLRRAPAAQSGG